MEWYGNGFPVTLTVEERKAKALKAADKLGRKLKLVPVVIEGPLAVTWWGKAWNRNLEGYSDYSNRLPRGRSYTRHGSVIDLKIEAGLVSALVQGSQSRPYEVKISIAAMDAKERSMLIEACAGKMDSAEALLGGRFPEDLTLLLTSEKTGLFPRPGGIRFSCSCPDSASLCKHVAATLYGVGARLDHDPTLFFLLRKIELEDLVSQAVKDETKKLLQAKGTGESVRMEEEAGDLSALFGIELRPAGKSVAPAVKSRGKPGRRISAKKNRLAMKNHPAMKDALKALEILSVEILKLESVLESILEESRI